MILCTEMVGNISFFKEFVSYSLNLASSSPSSSPSYTHTHTPSLTHTHTRTWNLPLSHITLTLSHPPPHPYPHTHFFSVSLSRTHSFLHTLPWPPSHSLTYALLGHGSQGTCRHSVHARNRFLCKYCTCVQRQKIRLQIKNKTVER